MVSPNLSPRSPRGVLYRLSRPRASVAGAAKVSEFPHARQISLDPAAADASDHRRNSTAEFS